MTILGVLFVTGIAFLATMNFEADMVAAQQLRNRNEVGVGAVVDEFGSILRDGLMAEPNVPFGGKLIGEAKGGFAELPGVHNLFAPIEPYQPFDTSSVPSGRFIFRGITDVFSLTNGPHDGSNFRALREYQVNGAAVEGIEMSWPGGVRLELAGGPSNTGYPLDAFDTPIIVPVDADGDGIVDTIQFPMSLLGFSKSQLAGIATRLNPPSNPTGEVYLGLRVIAHGGLVNLNESHPNLVAHVLDLNLDDLFICGTEPALGYFCFRPVLPPRDQAFYSPLLEEPILRRRVLLPPRIIPPSLLQGNPLLDPQREAFGDADMWQKLFPPDRDGFDGFETVYRHTYTPFTPDDPWDMDPAVPLWAGRMEPFESFNVDPSGRSYDRRHMVTTISHDDLLSRGGRWQELDANGNPIDHDLLKKMREANREVDPPVPCPNPLPFEYADYPQDIPNETSPNPGAAAGCDCPTRGADVCRFDPRKGRLQLSLPWLDRNFDCDAQEPAEQAPCRAQRRRLIHDVFMMLVSNAQGPYWEDASCLGSGDCAPGESCKGVCAGGTNHGRKCTDAAGCPGGACPIGVCVGGPNHGMSCAGNADCPAGGCNLGVCVPDVSGESRRESLISRTAASLTANMIDYMDYDGRCVGGSDEGKSCVIGADCSSRTCSDDRSVPTRVPLRSFDFGDPATAGRPLRTCLGAFGLGQRCLTDADCGANGPCGEPQYVYGLERQPFITEVATGVTENPQGSGNYDLTDRGVEIFNPYDHEIDLGDGYFLVETDGTPGGFATRHEIQLDAKIPPGQFVVYVSSTSGDFTNIPEIAGRSRVIPLAGANALGFLNGWRLYLVRKVTYPGALVPTAIVVDQFNLTGANIGVQGLGGLGPMVSMQRPVLPPVIWKATVPVGPAEVAGNTLGDWNGDDPNIRPVEVRFANTGSFTRPHPFDTDDDPNNNVNLGVAFPTTGSLLMLMRHANRSLDDYPLTTDLAFTTWLDDETPVGAAPPVQEAAQIDNGRMPVFDLGGAHHVDPGITAQNTPGGLRNLPWGQLVFDYFTALPLSSVGPYVNPDPNDPAFQPGAPDSIPRVDQNGLRVHGRININAAPWKVLGGVPLMPAEKLPAAFRNRITKYALSKCNGGQFEGLWCTLSDDCIPGGTCEEAGGVIGDSLAQAIVAYRELREVVPTVANNPFTGDYANDVNGRGWKANGPAYRRGTGFLTVGELANVRHSLAGHPVYRIDAGRAGELDANYVEAVARLVALGDWVTVRSQVFTVYGVLRGEVDEDIANPILQAADVDSRAIRFQETVDRLPTFLGEPVPLRIGQRVIGRYTDVRDD